MPILLLLYYAPWNVVKVFNCKANSIPFLPPIFDFYFSRWWCRYQVAEKDKETFFFVSEKHRNSIDGVIWGSEIAAKRQEIITLSILFSFINHFNSRIRNISFSIQNKCVSSFQLTSLFSPSNNLPVHSWLNRMRMNLVNIFVVKRNIK